MDSLSVVPSAMSSATLPALETIFTLAFAVTLDSFPPPNRPSSQCHALINGWNICSLIHPPTPSTAPVMPSLIFPQMPAPISFSESHVSSAAFLKSFHRSANHSVILPQLFTNSRPAPMPPAINSARPSGIFPASRNITPSTISAPTIKPFSSLIFSPTLPVSAPQSMATASIVNPATSMARPIAGCPAKAKTAPMPISAPPTSTSMALICPPILSFSVVHTTVTALNSVDSAATIRPIPSPICPVLNANTAPTAKPLPSAASIAPTTTLISSGMPSQLAKIALPIVTAPVAISARPRGMLAPESASMAPTASSAAPTISVILESES